MSGGLYGRLLLLLVPFHKTFGTDDEDTDDESESGGGCIDTHSPNKNQNRKAAPSPSSRRRSLFSSTKTAGACIEEGGFFRQEVVLLVLDEMHELISKNAVDGSSVKFTSRARALLKRFNKSDVSTCPLVSVRSAHTDSNPLTVVVYSTWKYNTSLFY